MDPCIKRTDRESHSFLSVGGTVHVISQNDINMFYRWKKGFKSLDFESVKRKTTLSRLDLIRWAVNQDWIFPIYSFEFEHLLKGSFVKGAWEQPPGTDIARLIGYRLIGSKKMGTSAIQPQGSDSCRQPEGSGKQSFPYLSLQMKMHLDSKLHSALWCPEHRAPLLPGLR